MRVKLKQGEDGFWGVIGREFTLDEVAKLCRAVSLRVEEGDVVVGYDPRFLSEQACEAVVDAIRPWRKVYVLTPFSSVPVLSFAVRFLHCSLGILLSGGEMPGYFHGVRFFQRDGFPFLFTDFAESPEEPHTPGVHYPVERISLEEPYLEHLLKGWDKEQISKKRMRVVVDSLWGADETLLKKIGEEFHMELEVVHPERDVLFGDCSAETSEGNLRELKEVVKKKRAEMGVVLGGGREKIGLVMETGDTTPPHNILLFLLAHLFERKGEKGGIVQTVTSSHLFRRFAVKHQVEIFYCPPGGVHLAKKVRETGMRFGIGEAGMLMDARHLWVADAYHNLLMLVEAKAYSDDTLSALLHQVQEKYGRMVRKRVDILVREEEKKEILKKFRTYPILDLMGWDIREVRDVEGIWYSFEGERNFLVRAGGTDTVVTIYLEAPREEEINGMEKKILEFIRGEG
ncbi:MAG: hypothetical protein V2G48_06065 [bacterium JZ-2024 1]